MEKNQSFNSTKQQLEVYEDGNGILHCKGRLGNSNLPETSKYPILLDTCHYFTRLVVISCHRKVMHNGVKETLTELRSKVLAAPAAPPLPEFRVKETNPFTFIGVDFAGPLFVKHRTTETQKVWLSLFTCCVTRAVHLEIVPDMLTSSFLRCFDRFVSRRGYPARVISDNGKTFKSAAKTLEDKLVWSFNIEKAPWWGGIFERMIQSVKRCLRKTIGGAKLSYDELVTVVIKIEAILNSRPISFVSTEDIEEPLTPSHLIYGRRILNKPDSQELVPDEVIQASSLCRRVQYVNQVLDHFWKRWSSEYLLELRNRYSAKTKSGPEISVGDVVIVHNENLPRCRWKIGRITELLPGADKQIRAVKLLVRSENGKVLQIRRPVQRLYPLETSTSDPDQIIITSNIGQVPSQLSSSSKGQNQHGKCSQSDQLIEDSSHNGNPPNPSQGSSQPPRRAAAQESDKRRKQWIKNLMS